MCKNTYFTVFFLKINKNGKNAPQNDSFHIFQNTG